MHCLALDIGRKHTGVAYADERLGVAIPLDTLEHDMVEELVEEVCLIVFERCIGSLVLGLPLLPDGKEGEQSRFVREVADALKVACPNCILHFLDERYTDEGGVRESDAHSQAAVKLLQVFLRRNPASGGG